MNRQQIVDLILQSKSYSSPDSWPDLVVMYAEILARISDKLTEEELLSLIALGAQAHWRIRLEYQSGFMANSLLTKMRNKHV